jgi:hypothetical protein
MVVSGHHGVEAGTFFMITSLKPVAARDWTQYTFSVGMAIGQVALSDWLWYEGERRHNRWRRKMLQMAAQIELEYNIASNTSAVANNYHIVAAGKGLPNF